MRSYKPDPAHFKEAERRIGTKKGWVHVGSSYYYDVEPCLKAKVPVIWVNRSKEQLDAGAEEADGRGQDAARGGEAARRRLMARAGCAPSACTPTSSSPSRGRIQTNCTLVRSGDEAFCIDSPVFPDELEMLPAVAEQAGFPVVGLLATHADWDHLLGRYAFPEAPLGCAETSAARLAGQPGEAQRELREFDEEHYVERPAPLSLPSAQSLPVPGPLRDRRRRAGAAPRRRPHGRRHGDLDPVGARAGLRATTCRRWRSRCSRRADRRARTWRRWPGSSRWSSRPSTSCPATAGRSTGARAAAILREDRAYLEALVERGAAATLPLARRTAAQRKIHAENVERMAPERRRPGRMHRLDPELRARR